MCSGDCYLVRSKDRRIVFPSMATTSSFTSSAREKVISPGSRPCSEARLKRFSVNQIEDAAERVVGWNAIRQVQKCGEPRPPTRSIKDDIFVTLSFSDGCGHGNDQHIGQRIVDFGLLSGVI